MAPSRETTIAAVAAGTAVAGIIAYGVYHREKTRELAAAASSTISATASAAANRTSTAFKSAQSAATSSASAVATSASATWDSLASKLRLRRLKRVKSFPIVTDDEDVTATVDQTSKAAKKAAKKVAQQPQSAGVPVAVMAK